MKQDLAAEPVPSNDDAGAPPQQSGDASSLPKARPALRVLLVEDLLRVQHLLRELIEEPGRLEVAGLVDTEADAILQYSALQPDAVVIDLNLRSGTGLGVIMALRRMDVATRPLLIVLTNHALPVLETACLNAGADYFLDKSRDFHKVRTLLEHAWSNSRAADTNPPRPVVPPGPLTH